MRQEFKAWNIIKKNLNDNPDQALFIDNPGEITTLAKFWELSGRVYHYLKSKGVTYEDVVMIRLPRSSGIYAAMAGVMRAGAAFAAVEDGFSSQRAEWISRDCEYRICIDREAWQHILETEPLDGAEPVDLHDKAFIAYTSGTTGHSKGAIHEYGTLMRDEHQCPYGKDILPIIPSLDFISAVIFFADALFYKIALAVVPLHYKESDKLLLAYMKEVGTTMGYLSPSFLRTHDITDLKWNRLIISSESADGLMIAGVENYNIYTSTESGRTISIYQITEPQSHTPIGCGVLKIKLLTEEGTEAAIGETGELCFYQPYFRGYQNMPEKSAHTVCNGWVHSGDSAVRSADGNLTITGRIAEEFKIGGYRINPEEIKTVLKSVIGLQNAVVRGFVFNNLYSICVFYTDQVRINRIEAREALKEKLPEYMIPDNYIHMDEFPMLEAGKPDKLAMLPPEGDWKQFRDEGIDKIKIIAHDRTADIYHLTNNKVLKLYHRNVSAAVVYQNMHNEMLLHGSGIPCPEVYGAVRFNECYGYIMASFA